jgi:hypothetical protein
MTRLTIKPQGIKGTTFEADKATVLKFLDFYASNGRAFCFYKSDAGWKKMSVAVAKRFAHVIGACERVVIVVLPRRFRFVAFKSRFQAPKLLTVAAKRKLPEKRLPYRKTVDIRFYRALVADGKVPAPAFNCEAIPQARQLTAVSVESFEERLAFELEFGRGYPHDLANLLACDEDAEALGWDWKWKLDQLWKRVWETQRRSFLQDLDALRPPLAEDTLLLGRFDGPVLLKALKEAKKHAAQLPKGFVKGFDKSVRLIHIQQQGTGIVIIPADSVGFGLEERFVVDGGNRRNLDPFHVSLALEQLHNTSAYPALLDLEKGKVILEINFSQNTLFIIGVDSGYHATLKLISSERREACWCCDGTGQAINEHGLEVPCIECHQRGYVPVAKS